MLNIIKQKLKKIYYTISGRNFCFYLKFNRINKTWVGNVYGGFYAHLDVLNKNSIIYSIGIGTDASFDIELIKKFNCNVYAYDPTPKSVEWVKKNISSEKFIFKGIGIDVLCGKKCFYLPRNKNHVSGSLNEVPSIDLNNRLILDFEDIDTMMKKNHHHKIDLLKIDIEGSEYDVLDDILNKNKNINQILVEFHPHLIKNGRKKTIELIKLMNLKKYSCFGVSDNLLEYSFIKYKN